MAYSEVTLIEGTYVTQVHTHLTSGHAEFLSLLYVKMWTLTTENISLKFQIYATRPPLHLSAQREWQPGALGKAQYPLLSKWGWCSLWVGLAHTSHRAKGRGQAG
jgi:hypothetical protein